MDGSIWLADTYQPVLWWCMCARMSVCFCVCVCVSCGNTPHHPLSLPGLTIHSQRIDVLPMAEIDFWGCCRVWYGAWVVWFVCSASNHESTTRHWASEMRGKCSHLTKWVQRKLALTVHSQPRSHSWCLHTLWTCNCMTVNTLGDKPDWMCHMWLEMYFTHQKEKQPVDKVR